MMKKKILVALFGLFLLSGLSAQGKGTDTGNTNWDYRALAERSWVLEVIDFTDNILVVGIEPVYKVEPGEPPEDFPSEPLEGYTFLRPEDGIEYYAILEEGNKRRVIVRHADGSVFLNNNHKSEGVFVIHDRQREPAGLYRNILQWPLEEAPWGGFFSSGYHGVSTFYAQFDDDSNTMEGIYLSTITGEERFRVERLPDYDWEFAVFLPNTPSQGYSSYHVRFLRRVKPGVWESDKAFGGGFRLTFSPGEDRIRLQWDEEMWQGKYPLMPVNLIPFDEVYTPDGRLKRH